LDTEELEALDPLHCSPVDVDGGVLAMQSWANREYRRGLSTLPCGSPGLRVSVVEVMFPTLNTWGWPVRNSRI
jgi:hypothetical protein